MTAGCIRECVDYSSFLFVLLFGALRFNLVIEVFVSVRSLSLGRRLRYLITYPIGSMAYNIHILEPVSRCSMEATTTHTQKSLLHYEANSGFIPTFLSDCGVNYTQIVHMIEMIYDYCVTPSITGSSESWNRVLTLHNQ